MEFVALALRGSEPHDGVFHVTRPFTALFFALSAIATAPFAIAAPGTPTGHPQTLTAHRPPHAALHGSLPPAALVGNPATRLHRPYGGTPIDVTTYHYDNNRTGWNQTETDLTPASVASSSFGLLATLNVDGNVFAQPLLVSNFVMPDHTTHDVLIVATSNDTVYAYDAQTYAILWQVSLGTTQSSNDVGCSDSVPSYGISATPVIVRKSANRATIYLVAATEPTQYDFHTQLHALDLGTGADTIAPVEVSPSATLSNGSTLQFSAQNQWVRVSLAYNNGSIYVGAGSHCDNDSGSISGWLMRYDTKLVLRHAFHTIETQTPFELASIWMTGFAPAIDASGNVYVITGNGDYQHTDRDWGESALRLPATLTKVADSFTEWHFRALTDRDQDFGSGGIMLLPTVAGQTAPPMAVAMGKSSLLFLLNQTNLGGVQKNNAGALQAQDGGGGGLWGGPAYYDGPAGPTVFTQTDSDVLRGWALATGATPSLTNTLTGTTGSGYGGSLPIVSSNGATSGTGVVWLIRRSVPIELEAYNATTLGAPIYSVTAGNWSNTTDNNPFLTPMEANGRVYVPAYLTVEVFGLTP
jgi:hypothetical protein